MHVDVRKVEHNISIPAFPIAIVFNILELRIRANVAQTVLVHQRKNQVNNTGITTLKYEGNVLNI